MSVTRGDRINGLLRTLAPFAAALPDKPDDYEIVTAAFGPKGAQQTAAIKLRHCREAKRLLEEPQGRGKG